MSGRWGFLDEPLPALTRALMDEQRKERERGAAPPAVHARQNGILVDLFDAMEQEQARINLLEASCAAAHAARDRARRNGKGRSRASQQRRAEHARLAEWCDLCRREGVWGRSVMERAYGTLVLLDRLERARWTR
jgi:hypothetical protein